MLNSILFTSLWMPRLGDIALTIVKYCLRATRQQFIFKFLFAALVPCMFGCVCVENNDKQHNK
jgi:hypothetical protein